MSVTITMNISGLGVDMLDGAPVCGNLWLCVVGSYGLSPLVCLGDSNHSVSPVTVD